jgi:hypothetical protein
VGLFIGLLIGGGFGLAFVLANAHSPLSVIVGLTLRLLATACFLVVIASVFRATRHGSERPDAPAGSRLRSGSRYGRGFWWVVIAEVVLLVVGLQVLRIASAPSEANVAWIALVVGLHFIAFAFVWREASIAVPGAIVFLLGVAGLALSATSANEWVPLVSGVCSGFVLLAGSLLGALAGDRPTERGERDDEGRSAASRA